MEIPLADSLNCVSPLPVEEDGIQFPIIAVNQVTANIPYSSNEIELICREMSKVPVLTVQRHYINIGWPSKHRKLPQELHTFWNYMEDLSMEDGWLPKEQDFSYLPHSEGRFWNTSMRATKELRSAC